MKNRSELVPGEIIMQGKTAFKVRMNEPSQANSDVYFFQAVSIMNKNDVLFFCYPKGTSLRVRLPEEIITE